jgi:hypothetical protein
MHFPTIVFASRRLKTSDAVCGSSSARHPPQADARRTSRNVYHKFAAILYLACQNPKERPAHSAQPSLHLDTSDEMIASMKEQLAKRFPRSALSLWPREAHDLKRAGLNWLLMYKLVQGSWY